MIMFCFEEEIQLFLIYNVNMDYLYIYHQGGYISTRRIYLNRQFWTRQNLADIVGTGVKTGVFSTNQSKGVETGWLSQCKQIKYNKLFKLIKCLHSRISQTNTI